MMLSFLNGTAERGADRTALRDGAFLGRVRAERMDLVLRLAPFTVLVSLGVVQVVVWLFWAESTRVYLAALDGLILPLAVLALARCRRWRRGEKPAEIGQSFVLRVCLVALAYGCLLGSVPVALFGGASSDGRLLIAATCAGLIATGMSAAMMPAAAISYSGPIIVGSFAALAMTGRSFYFYVAVLLALYAAFIIFTIVHLSRLVTMRVTAQADLERQQAFTNILLNDFEENASDWLWETDADLRLQHVSGRLVEVAGASVASLQGLPLERLFMPGPAPEGPPAADMLRRHVSARQEFGNVVLPVEIGGHLRWWSIGGKPIFAPAGGFVGYRGVGSDITERRNSEERLSYLAMHDALTDLPNRVSFQQTLEAALRAVEEDATARFAVLCLDLDGFKAVNDSFGHAAGDALLQGVAARLRVVSGPEAAVARLAGDEFAVLVRGRAVQDRFSIAGLASQIVDALGAPFHLDGIRVSVGVSIGIAVAPQDGGAGIMRRADVALYRMKGEGRNGHRFYEAQMDEAIEARRTLTADLRGALDRNEFSLAFQPLVGAADARVQGFEALLRWRHPARGLVSPAEFVSIAEETGVILPLGEWILREACRTAASWPAPVSVAVNLSAVQVRHSDLVGIVRSALSESGLPAERLELEVTESVYLDATPATLAMLRDLRAMRVRLSLDDFGTGYSSLSYLRRSTFDKIKIDRSFVADLPNDASGLAIVRAIIEMATSLGMTITAEGVETEAQQLCLLDQGCHQFQGYLFGKPMPARDAATLIAHALPGGGSGTGRSVSPPARHRPGGERGYRTIAAGSGSPRSEVAREGARTPLAPSACGESLGQ